jgi:hypothetical protein
MLLSGRMKRGLLLINYSLLIVFLAGCTSKLPFQKKSLSALSISSVPQAGVFINGESRGQTPFYEESLTAGEYTLQLKANSQEWLGKVKLYPEVLTVVNRELAPTEASQSGEIITLEKGRGLAVISNPTQAEIKVDGNPQGVTPLVIEKIDAGDHTVVLKAEGFLERMVKVRVRENYKLTVNMQLAAQASTLPSPQPEEAPAVPSLPAEPSGPQVIVKETGTSFGLHVRSGPGLGHPVIADIKPGGKYPMLGEKAGWINIRLPDGRDGWASNRYLVKKE